LIIVFIWDSETKNWIGNYKVESEYNSDNHEIYSLIYNWDLTTDSWIHVSEIKCYFPNSLPTKIQDLRLKSLLYPNPVKDKLTIQTNYTFSIELSIFNATGNNILQKKLEENISVINFSSFSAGVYYVRIEGNGTIFENHKIVKY
jgi:hypothetical protein